MLTVISTIKEEEIHLTILNLMLRFQEDKVNRLFHQMFQMYRPHIKILQLNLANLILKY
jgi:hypothetical protein